MVPLCGIFKGFPPQNNTPMTIFFQQILNALQLGSIYALIALGYSMVYSILSLINFAHGDIFMVGAFVGFFAATLLGLPFLPTLLLAMMATSLLGVAVERFAYRPLRKAPKMSAVITALGVGLFLENFTMASIGPERRLFPELIPVVNFNIQGVTISSIQILIILLTLALLLALDSFVQRSKTGLAMRAISYDRSTASLMGVNVDLIISLTFALGSALAAAGGILVGIAYPVIEPYMGILVGWKAFVAAVVGGIGVVRGAMVGGFILGAVEIGAAAALPSTYRDGVVFALLLAILVFKPTGILGKPLFKPV